MRTYRWILLVGLVLVAAGWLGGLAAPADRGVTERGTSVPATLLLLGELLTVVGAAGLLTVLLMRRVVARRLRAQPHSAGRTGTQE